uniref:Uncharacterized protein n=1 Tax=Rhizophora mucronata TaxID=61149 RepID=A0A2P2PRD9_RHIMU
MELAITLQILIFHFTHHQAIYEIDGFHQLPFSIIFPFMYTGTLKFIQVSQFLRVTSGTPMMD